MVGLAAAPDEGRGRIRDKPWQEYARRRRTPWNQPFPQYVGITKAGQTSAAEPIGQADYIVMPTVDGKEMLALADGVIHQLMPAAHGSIPTLLVPFIAGVLYLYECLREPMHLLSYVSVKETL